jgi:hypothetical protein
MANNQVPIPQNPIGESFVWRDWFQRLANRVFGSMSGQDRNAVFITGGVIDGTTIGSTTPAAGHFTTLSATTPIAATSGGTGTGTYAVGDILYCDTTNHLTKLSKPSQKSYLTMTSAGVPSWTSFCYGMFYSTSSQTAAAINTVYTVNIDTQDGHNNMSLASNAVTVTQAGVYNVMFSCQFTNSDAANIADVAIWPVINNVDVPWSATSTAIPNKHGGVNGYGLITANFLLTLAANDVVKMRWVTDNVNCSIFANTVAPPFTAPLIPGVVLTLQQVTQT